MKNLDNLRDCVKKAFQNGSNRGDEFRKMRHAIILDLKRLGFSPAEIKDKLLEWNEKCEKPLNLNEQKTQLFAYVDWTDKHSCKLGCTALKDYCIGQDTCKFYLKTTYYNRRKTQQLPFDIQEIEKFLIERFKGDSYLMMLIIRALRFHQQKNATGEIILIGIRKISSLIRDMSKNNIYHMDVFRKINLLIEEGILEKVIQGESGNFNKQANGYRFLAWKRPTHDPY